MRIIAGNRRADPAAMSHRIQLRMEVGMNSIFLRLRPYQTPEDYFRESLEEQEGVPFKVQPYAELEARFKQIREHLQEQPIRVDGDFFRMFHRRDGFFCLLRKGMDRMIEVGAIAQEKTDEVLERLYDHVPQALTNNVYFTINSYYRTLGRTCTATFLPRPARQEKNIRWLNACYVDIDVGRFGCENEFLLGKYCPELLPDDLDEKIPGEKRLTWEQALLLAMILEEQGTIPPVSVYARSGRGIYLFWLLEPVKFHYEKHWILTNYKACNRALVDSIRGNAGLPLLPGDYLATDGARILRIPSSIHTSTGARVCYWPSRLDDVTPERIYTLEQMMNFLQVKDATPSPDSPAVTIFKRAAAPFSTPARANGVKASMKYRLADAEKLFRERLIKKGKRYHSLRTMALFHLYAGTEEAEAVKHLEKLARFCRPPYPTKGEVNDIPVRKVVERAYHDEDKRPFLFSNQVLAKFWNIDKETAERLELRVLRPPAAGKLNVMSDKEKELRRRREALLRLEPENHSLTELLAMMKRKKYRLSETTLRSDLKALEEAGLIQRSNRKGGRPRKVEQ